MGQTWSFAPNGNAASNTPATAQSWTAPAGGWYAIEVQGGDGGVGGGEAFGVAEPGGYGAVVTGRIHLEAGDVLAVWVGSQGTFENSSLNPTPGYHTGGPAGYPTQIGGGVYVGSSGGGSSAILVNGTLIAEAAGGGGTFGTSAGYGPGGSGGLPGTAGAGAGPGGGATGTAEGGGGTSSSDTAHGQPGSAGDGGAGGYENGVGSGYSDGGSGGGGGYHGGGGGGAASTGGGGACYIAATVEAAQITNSGSGNDPGQVIIRQVPGSIVTII